MRKKGERTRWVVCIPSIIKRLDVQREKKKKGKRGRKIRKGKTQLNRTWKKST